MYFIYLMDRFVWLLLFTVFTTAGLQFAGVVATKEVAAPLVPPVNTQFEMDKPEKDFSYELREKRQSGDRSPVVDGIFNIPIATLTAVNDLIQNSRPALQRIREGARALHAQRRNDAQTATHVQAPRHVAQFGVEDLPINADGSSYKI